MSDVKTHWRKLDNPNYIGAYAFQPGEEKTLTISEIRVEEITGADGKKENCTIVHWVETNNKPMILNSTNAKMITKLTGSPYIEDWTGRSIVLGVETVSAFGERVEAVRVKKKQVQAINAVCSECGQIIQGTDKFGAAQIAAASVKKFGRALCLDCVEKEKGA